MRLLRERCPLCPGTLLETPTSGRWQCCSCRATLLIGAQEAVRHVVGQLQPPRPWPEVEEPDPVPLETWPPGHEPTGDAARTTLRPGEEQLIKEYEEDCRRGP